MIYRLPELSDKEMLMAYVSEHWANGENRISASVRMLAGEFSDWVRNIHKNASIGKERGCNHMKNKNEVSVPLLAFTFFYSVAIYVFLLGFIFWDKHKQDDAE